VDYVIENKGSTNRDAVRALTTGIRAADGTEHRFEAPFEQILGPGEKLEVKGETVPHEMHEGMEDENRAERFVFWARFTDAGRRRWEATYDPVSRTTAGFAGTKPQPRPVRTVRPGPGLRWLDNDHRRSSVL
jgi:hypothetical protein